MSSYRTSRTARRKQEKTPSTLTDRAFVLATLQEMVNSGLAFRRTRSEHQSELCLLSGEVFILDKLGIKRVL
jgi:formate dehydrogenase assembly factor FdhD